MDMSHDHIDFGPQILFLGSEGLFSQISDLDANMLHIYFINKYINIPTNN
jgi:hypothetical protein